MEPKKLIVFDLDGTLTPESTWMRFSELLGISKQEDMTLFESYANGVITYDEWTSKLVGLYRIGGNPVRREDVERLACSVPFRDGATDIVSRFRAHGFAVLILSGSLDEIVRHAALRLGADAWLACSRCVFDAAGVLRDIESSGDEGPAKFKLLSAFCEENGFALDSAVCVGDSENDADIFRHAIGVQLGDAHELQHVSRARIGVLNELAGLLP